MTTATRTERGLAGPRALIAGLVLAVAAVPASAQVASPADARWQPWLGCWASTGDQGGSTADAKSQSLCVIPAAGGSAVELATIADGQVIERQRVEATGVRRPVQKEGCTGFETAEFSADSRRVYLRSEYMCTGDVRRTSTGLIAMATASEWLDIQTVNVGDAKALRVMRYRAATPASVPAEIAALLQDASFAAGTSRLAAATPITIADVFDVSSHVDAPAVEAWILERRPEFTLEAAAIASLADAGLPTTVIDLMVALAYPERFEANLTERGSALRPAQQVASAGLGGGMANPFHWDRYGSSRLGRYYYSPYGYSRYGMMPNGYGIGYGYGNFQSNRPLVIVVAPSELAVSRATMVKGRGYSSGRTSPSTSSKGSSSGSSTSSGKSSSGTSSSGTSSSSGSTGRQAKVRPPPSGS